MRAVACFLLILASCSAPDETTVSPASWSDDLRVFCEKQSSGWMMQSVARIDRSLPSEFSEHSTRLEGINLQNPFDGRDDVRELQLRLTAMRGQETVHLSAYSVVEPGKCVLQELEVIEGYDRFDPPFRVTVAN